MAFTLVNIFAVCGHPTSSSGDTQAVVTLWWRYVVVLVLSKSCSIGDSWLHASGLCSRSSTYLETLDTFKIVVMSAATHRASLSHGVPLVLWLVLSW